MTQEEIQEIRDDAADAMRLECYLSKFSHADLYALRELAGMYEADQSHRASEAQALWIWIQDIIAGELHRRACNERGDVEPIEPTRPRIPLETWSARDTANALSVSWAVFKSGAILPRPPILEFVLDVHGVLVKYAAALIRSK